MYKKIAFTMIIGLLLIVGFGCSKKEPVQNNVAPNTQAPAAQPSIGQPSGKPVNEKEVSDKVTKALDEKFPGEWEVSGTTLKKGSYTENNKYGMADAIASVYSGSMVSIFAGEKRVSSTVRGGDFSTYPVPTEVGETLKSGKLTVAKGDSNFQKVYLPIKSGDKTIAVISISF